MSFTYPKKDLRKKERITIRIDSETLNKLKEISDNRKLSAMIRSILINSIKK